MKKKSLIILLLLVIIVTGCKNKEKKENKELVDGGWEIVLTNKQVYIPEDAKNAFDNAFNKDSYDLNIVALLAKQVVSGTNYMFLCKDNSSNDYKIVIVYNNLDNVSQITKMAYFDYTKYAHNNTQYYPDRTVGRWDVIIPDEETELDEEVRDIYNTGIQKVPNIDYKPIALLGKQVVSGTNYAVLAYGKLQKTDTPEKGIFLLTVYKDLNGTIDIPSLSYIDLKEFNE